ncbi:hypothetical protein [Streptacidiphilus monticola]|uniref:Sensor domain-containing protein n=1 Tax=Streptacidiphilus monticola TaxID=2161674 RepID=A0ABW1GC61_9ACTN
MSLRQHRTVRAAAAGATVVALGLVGAACSSGGSTNNAVIGSSTSAASSSPAVISQQQLQSALLTAGDLQSPYSPAPSDTSSPSTVQGCTEMQNLGGASGLTKADASFQASDNGPFVEEHLGAGPAATLDAAYTKAAHALQDCSRLTITSGQVRVTLTLTPVNAGGGVASTAKRMDGSYQGVAINGYVALTKLQNAAMLFTFIQVGSTSSQQANAFYQQAVTKADQTLNGSGSSTPATLS